MLSRYPRFADLIEQGEDEELSYRLCQADAIGRPLGTDNFIARLERKSGRLFRPAKRGPKPKSGEEEN